MKSPANGQPDQINPLGQFQFEQLKVFLESSLWALVRAGQVEESLVAYAAAALTQVLLVIPANEVAFQIVLDAALSVDKVATEKARYWRYRTAERNTKLWLSNKQLFQWLIWEESQKWEVYQETLAWLHFLERSLPADLVTQTPGSSKDANLPLHPSSEQPPALLTRLLDNATLLKTRLANSEISYSSHWQQLATHLSPDVPPRELWLVRYIKFLTSQGLENNVTYLNLAFSHLVCNYTISETVEIDSYINFQGVTNNYFYKLRAKLLQRIAQRFPLELTYTGEGTPPHFQIDPQSEQYWSLITKVREHFSPWDTICIADALPRNEKSTVVKFVEKVATYWPKSAPVSTVNDLTAQDVLYAHLAICGKCYQKLVAECYVKGTVRQGAQPLRDPALALPYFWLPTEQTLLPFSPISETTTVAVSKVLESVQVPTGRSTTNSLTSSGISLENLQHTGSEKMTNNPKTPSSEAATGLDPPQPVLLIATVLVFVDSQYYSEWQLRDKNYKLDLPITSTILKIYHRDSAQEKLNLLVVLPLASPSSTTFLGLRSHRKRQHFVATVAQQWQFDIQITTGEQITVNLNCRPFSVAATSANAIFNHIFNLSIINELRYKTINLPHYVRYIVMSAMVFLILCGGYYGYWLSTKNTAFETNRDLRANAPLSDTAPLKLPLLVPEKIVIPGSSTKSQHNATTNDSNDVANQRPRKATPLKAKPPQISFPPEVTLGATVSTTLAQVANIYIDLTALAEQLSISSFPNDLAALLATSFRQKGFVIVADLDLADAKLEVLPVSRHRKLTDLPSEQAAQAVQLQLINKHGITLWQAKIAVTKLNLAKLQTIIPQRSLPDPTGAETLSLPKKSDN
jgi:hypothetical protein